MPTKPIPDRTIDLAIQTRAASLVAGTANMDARTVEMVWSSGAAVRRRDRMTGEAYDEVLVLDTGACDLSRLNGGAPFLNAHGAWDLSSVIGVVERAWIADGPHGPEGRAVVRFSDRADVEPIWRDVAAGIVRNVSVGYAVRSYEISDGDVPMWRATAWQPLELSAVPVGADPGAGFRSAAPTHPCQLVRHQEDTMSDDAPATDQPEPEPAAAPPPTAPAPPDPSVVAERAVATERARIAGIYDAQGKLGVTRTVADGLVTRGVALDDARRVLIDEAAKADATRETRATMPTGMTIPGGQDETVTRRSAIEGALLHRFNPTANGLEGPAGEWRGLTLLEMARAVLDAEGERTRGLTRDEVATRALHAGSDFPRILAGVAGKTLRQAYEAAPRTFQPFCRQVTSPDFKDVHRVQLGEAPSLIEVKENGEISRGTIGEGEETYRLKPYGRIFGVTRQALINDDLGAFTRVPQMFGNAAARLEGDIVWGIFIANARMADGTALFHVNHKNVAAAGSKLSVDSIGKGRTNLARQTGLDGKTVLNIRPSFLIVPASLELAAEQLIAVNLVPARSMDAVPASIRTLAVIAEPRLDDASTIAWYLAADPAQIDTIEYAYLEGQIGVHIETRMGFDVDGIEIKARHDFAAKAIDWRGMYRDPGA